VPVAVFIGVLVAVIAVAALTFIAVVVCLMRRWNVWPRRNNASGQEESFASLGA
jgi:hypothetical protein